MLVAALSLPVHHHQAASGGPAAVAIAALVLAFVASGVIAAWVLFGPFGRGSGGSDWGDDGGGGGDDPPPGPLPIGPGWWPEFEREFAAYAAVWERPFAGDSPNKAPRE